MRQRVKPWTRWHGGILVPSMSGVGLVESGGGEPGDLVHGQEFTISGSGFGTRPDYNFDDHEWQGARHIHWRWTDLANGFPANGSSQAAFQNSLGGFFPATLFDFTSNPGSVNLSIQNGGPSQSGKYLRKTSSSFAEPGYLQTDQAGSPIPNSPNAYVCYKAKPSGNGKVVRWWNQGGGDPNWYWGLEGAFTREYSGGFTQWIGSNPLSGSAFRRVEHYLADGNNSRLWVNGSAVTFTGSGPHQGTQTLALMSGQNWQTSHFTLPNSVDSGGIFEYADIYLDFTAARVEVTVGSTTEIQILSSWADGKIVGRFNKGAMSSGAGTIRVYSASNTVIHTEARAVS